MKSWLKTSLIIVPLALVICIACLVWLVSRPDTPMASRASGTFRGGSFDVHVDKPRMDRFLFGILPTKLEGKLLGGELRFHHASPGARIGAIRAERLELGADGWDLLIESDGKGGVGPGTRLVFPVEMAEVQRTLRCRPADPANGYFNSSVRPGSDVLDGTFSVEIVRCEDSKTGKILDTEAGGNPGDAWPSDALTLRGSFQGLPVSQDR